MVRGRKRACSARSVYNTYMPWLGLVFLVVANAFADIEPQAKVLERLVVAPCCWNAVVAEHDSEASRKIKEEIRLRLSRGESQKDILAYFEREYGERILASPKNEGIGKLFWVMPFIFIIMGTLLVVFFLRSKPSQPITRREPIDPEGLSKLRKEIYSVDP